MTDTLTQRTRDQVAQLFRAYRRNIHSAEATVAHARTILPELDRQRAEAYRNGLIGARELLDTIRYATKSR